MGFLSFVVLLAIAYMLWRISDQMPDIIFRISEIQRDVAELRRRTDEPEPQEPASTPGDPSPPEASSDD